MANSKKTNKVMPAMLAEGEPVISEELAKKYKESLERENLKKMIKTEDPKPKSSGKKPGSMASTGDNAIGSPGANRVNKPSAKAGQKKPTVAIYSDRNVSWVGVGKISKGYNIVTKEQAERWLTRNHVREATPEEVASKFGV